MKKAISLLSVVLFSTLSIAQSSGELSVAVNTSSAGGNYAPRNILAIWIEDEGGNFVKTLLAYADKRKTHLNAWQTATANAGSEFNRVDAITGATKSNHATRTCTWDATDVSGVLVADGSYKLCMELTDKNATGNFASCVFTKGINNETLNPTDKASFSAVGLVWEPDEVIEITDKRKELGVFVSPNPGSGVFQVHGSDIMGIEIHNISGKLKAKTKNTRIDISNEESGVYLFVIETNKGTLCQKVIKQ